MRILHLNYDAQEKGGASIAMIRIHRALLAEKVDSIIACIAHADVEASVLLKRPLLYRVLHFFGKCLMKVLFRGCHSTGFIPSGIVPQINALKPDIIVLHWLQQDTISMRELMHVKAPLFWMHHDLWPTMGLQPYTQISYWWRWYWPWARWVDSFVRRNKRYVFRRLGARLQPVAQSDWCYRELVQSGAYGTVNPIKISCPLSDAFVVAACRLGEVPRPQTEKFTILNGSRDGFCGGVKGGDRLLAALRWLSPEERAQMRLQIFGDSTSQEVDCGMEVEHLGWHPPEELPQFYRAADVFAFPSRQETFGQTKIEALACGTPVVCFDETACAESVAHLKTGYVARSDDVDDFVCGIRHYFELWKENHECRVTGGLSPFTPSSVAQMWIKVAGRTVL